MRPLLFVIVLTSSALARPVLLATVDPDTEAAARHFSKGADFYEHGAYAAAIIEFKAAKALKAAPALDFNIGRAEDRLERWGAASDAYAAYLNAAPNAPEAKELQERIALLRARVAPPLILPAVPENTVYLANGTPVLLAHPEVAPPTPTPSHPFRKAAIATGGGAAAALIAAIVSGVVAHVRYDELGSICGGFSCESQVNDFAGRVADGRAAGLASDALVGTAVVAAVASAALFVVDRKIGDSK